MSLWRPAGEYRQTREYWGLGEKWISIVMSELTARLVYNHICVIPVLARAANDRDGKRW
jgi:hypothetical protein